MKVLENNYKKSTDVGDMVKIIKPIKPYPRKITCENCGSILEYMESDLRMGAWGCMYIDCPCCGEGNMLADNENNITLTAENIEFPTHFWHVSANKGAANCCNTEEIRKRLSRAIAYFRENKDDYHWYSESGNLCIHVHRWEGDEIYEIHLSNDYYSMEIPFEREDYR